MSIIALDGFDLYDAGTDVETNVSVRREIWNEFTNLDTFTYEARNNGNAVTSTSPLTWIRSLGLAPVTQHAIFGCAFRVDEEPSSAGSEFLDLHLENGSLAFRLFTRPPADSQFNDFRLAYEIDADGGDQTLIPVEYARDVWHFVEAEFNATLGTVKVWMNGSLALDTTVTTGHNVQDLRVFLKPQTLDDLYWLDGADGSQGATFQARLGPIQIRPVPLSSDQTPSELISLGGGDKYLEVDEQPGGNDKDVSYMYTQQAPRTQMFGVTGYDATLPIIALTAFTVAKQVAPNLGAAKVSFVADDGTLVESSPTTALDNQYRMYSEDYVLMPDGTAIDMAKIEAAKWGVKVLPES